MGKIKQDRSGLSKAYRLKKKLGKIKKPEIKTSHSSNRVVIKNIPFKATENDIRNLFSPFGEINEINLLKRSDGSLVGCGFVQFKIEEDASKAIFQTNKKEFMGRTLSCSWAIPKSKYSEILKAKEESQDNDANEIDGTDNNTEKSNEIKNTEEKKRKSLKKPSAEERKAKKLKKQRRRARIVVRNLPFKSTEENIKEFFSKYGNIDDIQIPSKSDGKKVGCCFIQFDKVNSAAKAIHYANLKEFLDRTIVVDWAIAKKTFDSKVKSEIPEIEIKEEDGEDTETIETVTIKEELENEDEKSENEHSDDDDVSDEVQSDTDEDNSIKKEESSDESEEDEDNDEDNLKDIKQNDSRPKRFSNDIEEQKTVFLKNVPFRATNDDLKSCMEQLGPVYYALICIDKLTEHSKGSAFVKFRHMEDAKKCLEAGTELQIFGQVLDPHPALSKKQITDKANDNKHKSTDSRNLYLIKEGVVLAGSPASKNVSVADMAKRLKIEHWKSQILKNLNMFVSKVRLVVHNLPPTLTDSGFRSLICKHAPRDAVVTETRVMKHNKGVGESKEFGFVAFTKHEDALQTLRVINNNPNIFSEHRRPIVSFSIENKVMVNAKQNRLIKSKKNNPTCSEYIPRKIVKQNETPNNKRKDLPNGNTKSRPPFKKGRTPSKQVNQKESNNNKRKTSFKKHKKGGPPVKKLKV